MLIKVNNANTKDFVFEAYGISKQNSIKISEDKVCNWIDDCDNGRDEQVPLPCEGEPSSLELELYVILTMIFGIWIVIISILLKTTYNSQEKYVEENQIMRDKLIFMMISPGLLLFINICFLCAANIEDKSIIVEYYITNCVFVSLCLVISLCIGDKCNIGLWFGLFLLTIITMYHGSIVFSYIPSHLFKEVDYNNITTTAFNSSINNLFSEDQFWLTHYNQSENFVISFDKTIYLTTIVLYPTYPYKTTDQFSISIGMNLSNWTTILRGPMPFISNKSSLETTFSDDGIPIKYLKFTGTPYPNCNNTVNKKCFVGLDTLELYELNQN